MFASLRHRSVSGIDDENRTVHLSGAGDHILDVVRVTRAIDVSIVSLVRFVLNVGHRDGDDLRRVTDVSTLGDILVGLRVGSELKRLTGHDGSRQRCLAVVDVADRAYVHVRLLSLEFILGHWFSLASLQQRILVVIQRPRQRVPPHSRAKSC